MRNAAGVIRTGRHDDYSIVKDVQDVKGRVKPIIEWPDCSPNSFTPRAVRALVSEIGLLGK
jgi:hypothetical protein